MSAYTDILKEKGTTHSQNELKLTAPRQQKPAGTGKKFTGKKKGKK